MYWLEHNFGHWAEPIFGSTFFAIFFPVIILLIAWSLIWKGIALWKAARAGDTAWFMVFLLVNTLGILEILYIYVFSKKSKEI